MADIVQKFTIKGVADVRDVIQGINTIKDSLKKLAVSPETQASFDRLFSKIEKQAERANEAMASGFKQKGDVSKYTDAVGQISSAYDELIRRIDVLKTKNNIVLNVKTDAFKQAKTDLDSFSKALVKAKNDLAAVQEKSANGIMTAAGGHTTNQALWKQIQDNFTKTKVDVDQVTDALKKLKDIYNKADTKGWTQGTNAEKWATMAAEIKAVEDRLREYNEALQKEASAQGNFDNAQQTSNTLLQEAAAELEKASVAARDGSGAFKEYAKGATDAAKSSQQLSSELDQFKSRIAYFFGLSNAVNLFKRAVRSAFDTVKDLDAIMTETAVVTDFNVGDMWERLPEYTQRANELGVTIHDTYEAATLFYQQGLKTNEVMQISNETLKMARIAGLDAATASDRMTNALRGFNMELDKTSAQRVNDVYSKLAAITASNTDEISTAMTKVASLAHNANMEFETTAAFLAQIIESTRESAETAGTALKTVVARFSEVKKLYTKGELLGQDEEGEEIDVNKVSTALRSAGINLNEYLTGAKGLDDIFIELAGKWDNLDQVQQRYIATMAAGSRQQSRFIALMSDYQRTTQLVEAANNANGASQEQYGKTLESLQTKLARLKNAWNEFILGLANSDAIKKAVDLLTGLITTINKLIKTISGKNSGAKMITTFITAFTAFKVGKKLFNKSPLGGIFSQLVASGNREAIAGGTKVASIYYSNLADKIVKFSNNGNVIGALKRAGTSFTSGIQNYFTADASFIQEKLFDKLDPKMTNAQFDQLWNSLDKGNLTVGELNKALRDSGNNFQITKENAAEFGIVMEDDNTVIGQSVVTMKKCSVAAIGIGTAFTIVGSILEKQGGILGEIGKVIKTVGAGLMVFGTIMSVILPLQVELGAKKITAAISSIPIVGQILLIISLITALGVAIAGIAKNNSASAKLEEASNAAEKAAEAADEAKKAFNELNEAWNELDDKKDAIENATKGTQQWRDAVKALNEQVLELMNTYKGIEVKRNSEGILQIVNQEDLINEQEQKVYQTEATARFANVMEYNRKVKDNYSSLTNWYGGSTGLSRTVDNLEYHDKLKDIDLMSDDDIKELIGKFNGMGGTDYREPSKKNIEKIRNYAKVYNEQQDYLTQESRAFGATVLEKANISDDSKKYANSFLSDEYLNKLTKENQDKYDKWYIGKNTSRELYAKSQGYTKWSSYASDHPEDKDATATELKNRMAAADALEEAARQTELFTKNLKNLDNDTEKALFEEQNGGALTKSQTDELKKYNDDQIKELYKSIGGDDVYGKDGEKAFKEWFKNSINESITNFDTKKYGEMFGGYLRTSLTDSLTSETFKDFAENMWSVYTTSGYVALSKVQESLHDMTKDMEPEEIEKFMSSINKLDWTSVDSIKDLESLADKYGISQDAIKQLEQQIIEFNNAVNQVDLEKLKSFLGLVKDVTSGEHGRSFTEEEYNNAIENGANKKDFVYNINTGNYDYIGKSLDNLVSSALERAANYSEQLKGQYNSGVAANKIANEQTDVNISDPDSLRNFIGAYISAAGSDSLFTTDILEGNLSILQDAYNKIMQDAYNMQDYAQKKQENDIARYQLMSPTAIVGAFGSSDDQVARDIYKQQIANSAMSEELKEHYIENVDKVPTNGSTRSIYTQEAIEGANIMKTLEEGANLGFDAEELTSYVDALRQVDELANKSTDDLYALALANAKYQEGLNNLANSYDDWIKLKNEEGSLKPTNGDELEIYEDLKKNFKEMLNLTEDVSDEFLQLPGTAELLERAINGDIDAVSELRANLAKANLEKFGIKDEDNVISNFIDNMMKEAPTLEFGATLDQSQFGQGLLEAMQAADMTVGQMQALFNTLGWAPELDYEEIDVKDAEKFESNGSVEIADPEHPGKTIVVPTHSVTDYATDGKVLIPKIGNATFVKPSLPSATPKSSSGSRGGGGSAKKKTYWENPYDELYNLQEKINEALRTREALERRYQKLLKQEQATLSDIRKSYYAQISNLRTEADLQKQFAAGRLRQISEVGNKIYTDSEGNRKSFNSLGVTKYASYNAQTGLIQIDWNGLDAISKDSSREEEGKAAEAYISKLEELVSSYEEVRDKLWDIEDKIEDLRDAAIESYLSFEDRVMEAIVNSYQQQIDSYQSMSDAIDKANTEVIDSLQKQIDLSRQIRDNTEKEKDISDKENRLAYLQRDTSGANDLEIQKLEKELKDAREGYTDTLIDQAIQNMQDDADTAAEQRARQIETMTEQLEIMKDTGALWQNVYELMNAAAEGDGALSPHSSLVKLLQETEAFASLSNIGQAKWWSEVAEEFHKAWIGLSEAEDKYKKDANNDGTIYDSGTQSAIEEVQQAPATQPTPTPAPTPTQSGYDEKTKYGVALAVCDGYWGNGETRKRNLESKGFNYSEIQGIVNKVIKDANSGAWYGKYYGIKDTSQYKMSKFKTGGLADFTGPAWLDGTKSKPEIILNAQDSANFIALKDILASLLSVQGGRGIIGNGGDNYFDIDISASLGSDYDVDQLKEKIKRDIYNDGQYRNVNTINYLR